MRTFKLLALVSAVALVTAGCFHDAGTNPGGNATTTNENNQTPPQARTVQGTFADLLNVSGNESLRCTYEYDDGGGNRAQGVAYIDPVGNRLRSDIDSVVEGRGNVTVHVLVANEALYVWSDQDPGGIVFPYEGSLANAEPFRTDSQYQSDLIQQDLTYACVPAEGGAQRWEVPADVSFVNFTSLNATSTSPTATSTRS